MTERRQVKLFRNGRNQAVRIPREFELPGPDAILIKDGDRLILEPANKKSLIEVLATFEPTTDDFPPIADKQPEPVDLD
jgi:antitoxin VapB